jgi:hypothetical protein
MRTRAKEKKRQQQNTNKRREGGAGEGMGPAAGAQVSAATQRTCTSDSGTDVRTTLPSRYDSVMTHANGKGGCERDNSTMITKPGLNDFRVLTSLRRGTTGSDGFCYAGGCI